MDIAISQTGTFDALQLSLAFFESTLEQRLFAQKGGVLEFVVFLVLF